MTKEVAEKIVRGITDKIECNTADIDDWAEFWGFTKEEYEEFLDMAIEALEQEDIFDKIRAEIEQLTSRYTISRERGGMGQVEWSDMLIKESEVLQIIDKYKAESEPKDGGNELTELTNPFGDSRFGG